jgi:S-disulfanyl-L-cysteine oxidoreductase SoxD
VLKISAALLAGILLSPAALCAQTRTLGLGHVARTDAVNAIDIDVLPDGQGLPPGSGSAVEGRAVYVARCAACHGPTGKEGPYDLLVGGQDSLRTARPLKTVGSFWPYATTLWDYINRAMPFAEPRSLAADDVYAVTAYVLFLNGIVTEQQVLSQETLAQVKMPNRTGFVPDDRANENLPRK